MVRVEVIKGFTLGRYDELKDMKRISVDRSGELFIGDTFLCTNELADYLTGNNPSKSVVVRVIEVIPEEPKKVEEPKIAWTNNVLEPKIEPKAEPKAKITKTKKTKK